MDKPAGDISGQRTGAVLSPWPLMTQARIVRETSYRKISMNRCSLSILPLFLLGVAGCALFESNTELVPASPFGFAPANQAVTQTSFAPSSLVVAARVDALGA